MYFTSGTLPPTKTFAAGQILSILPYLEEKQQWSGGWDGIGVKFCGSDRVRIIYHLMKASKKHSRRDIPYTDNLKVLPSGEGEGKKKRTMCILVI